MRRGTKPEVIFDGYFEVLLVTAGAVTLLARPRNGIGNPECLDLPADAFLLAGHRLEAGAVGVLQKVLPWHTTKVEYSLILTAGPANP